MNICSHVKKGNSFQDSSTPTGHMRINMVENPSSEFLEMWTEISHHMLNHMTGKCRVEERRKLNRSDSCGNNKQTGMLT